MKFPRNAFCESNCEMKSPSNGNSCRASRSRESNRIPLSLVEIVGSVCCGCEELNWFGSGIGQPRDKCAERLPRVNRLEKP